MTYKKPFECGWRRELVSHAKPHTLKPFVWLANFEEGKDKADVYFMLYIFSLNS